MQLSAEFDSVRIAGAEHAAVLGDWRKENTARRVLAMAQRDVLLGPREKTT
jgi:hypothetical protein